jgi:hypothetical protein
VDTGGGHAFRGCLQPVNRWLILIAMQIILLIFGMFMDDYAVLTICAPIFIPIAVYLGFDPVWFAIVFILNMHAGRLFNPTLWLGVNSDERRGAAGDSYKEHLASRAAICRHSADCSDPYDVIPSAGFVAARKNALVC